MKNDAVTHKGVGMIISNGHLLFRVRAFILSAELQF